MTIRWEAEAEKKLIAIENYLVEEFGLRVSENFTLKTLELVESLVKQPFKGQPSVKNEEVRKIRLSKTVVAYYSVLENEIVILDLFDQRQDPNKSKF